MSSGSLTVVPSGVRLWDRFRSWLDAMPHPAVVCEVSATQVAGARASRVGAHLEAFAVESLPEGAVVPSPVELNIVEPPVVRAALKRVADRVQGGRPEVALLVPDQAVRVFLLPFDEFPSRAEDAVPLLRWRLKKSVPFDVEDTVVSYLAQPGRQAPAAGGRGGLDVLAAVARQRIIRQYEELAEAAGMQPGVVLGSTLATLPLLEEDRATLLARMAGTTLTTAVVRSGLLCVYRCTEMSAGAPLLEPQALLDEVYPAVAFFQDTWQESVAQVRLAGFGARYEEFRHPAAAELGCGVAPLGSSAAIQSRLAGEARGLLDRQLEGLLGWILNRGA